MTKQLSVKDWLRQMIGFEARIKAKSEQIDKYIAMANRITSTPDGVHVSGGDESSRIETGVLGYVSAQDIIKQEIEDLFQLRYDVMTVINAIKDQRYRDVLEQYYITGWTWQRIAEEHGWDISWVHRLHARALSAAEPHYLKNILNIVH